MTVHEVVRAIRAVGEADSASASALFVEVTEIAGGVRLVAVGEIDMATAPIFAKALVSAIHGNDVIEVDLSDVSFMDSQGLKALLDTHVAGGNRLAVVAASRSVRRLLKATGMLTVLAPRLDLRSV